MWIDVVWASLLYEGKNSHEKNAQGIIVERNSIVTFGIEFHQNSTILIWLAIHIHNAASPYTYIINSALIPL
jgi:hypothetical protein